MKSVHPATNPIPKEVRTQVKLTVIDELKKIIRSRFDCANNELNLGRIDQITDLRRDSAATETPAKKSNFWPAIIKMAKDLYPHVKTVSLAGNELKSLATIAHLGNYLPDLENLSLEDNMIATFRDLDYLADCTHPLKKLRGLILRGNPIQAAERAKTGDDSLFYIQILKRFPGLTTFDGMTITPEMRAVAAPAAPPLGLSNNTEFPLLPRPVQPTFFDTDATMQLANQFLGQFFQLFDHQRSALMDWYDPNATFSLMINRERPKRTGPPPFNPKMKGAEWTAYTNRNRNRKRINKPTKQTSTLCTGPAEILHQLSRFPTSVHPLDDMSRFSVYAWQISNLPPSAYPGPGQPAPANMPPAIQISVTGEFYEPQEHTMRSFDRIFFLVPSLVGSKAQLAGCPFSIRNDMLTLRIYAGFDAWNPSRYPILPQAHPTAFPSILGLVEQLQQRTRLAQPFAVQCLQEHNWDLEKAATAVLQLQQSNAIPSQAYQS
ncbi:hypothetical protein BJ085DRAFT_21115 [Dimargaris cristalligena]|uniref:NTF2-like protein n=1 Tax=Dimargaris cristalligena TaxID=215637 RepID=A0A4P9ZUL6_9FUNG|nr:hypothetical protein BJ085DRAFT_21115 [Dimargaris cristalligena]|eukprot:RKP36492.1 hypothetical protein BJ085DRAFT_21115 [Dimargaris cristalligena]